MNVLEKFNECKNRLDVCELAFEQATIGKIDFPVDKKYDIREWVSLLNQSSFKAEKPKVEESGSALNELFGVEDDEDLFEEAEESWYSGLCSTARGVALECEAIAKGVTIGSKRTKRFGRVNGVTFNCYFELKYGYVKIDSYYTNRAPLITEIAQDNPEDIAKAIYAGAVKGIFRNSVVVVEDWITPTLVKERAALWIRWFWELLRRSRNKAEWEYEFQVTTTKMVELKLRKTFQVSGNFFFGGKHKASYAESSLSRTTIQQDSDHKRYAFMLNFDEAVGVVEEKVLKVPPKPVNVVKVEIVKVEIVLKVLILHIVGQYNKDQTRNYLKLYV